MKNKLVELNNKFYRIVKPIGKNSYKVKEQNTNKFYTLVITSPKTYKLEEV